MSTSVIKTFSPLEFNQLLNDFQEAVEKGQYTEKIPYGTWRKLKSLGGMITVECRSPFVRVLANDMSVDGGVHYNALQYSAKIYGWGFGRFFYDTYMKERKDDMYDINYAHTTTATSSTAAIDSAALTIAGDSYLTGSLNLRDSADTAWDTAATTSQVDSLKARITNIENNMKNNENKGSVKMKGFNFDFGPVSSNNIRMSMYGLAVKNASGSWVSYDINSMSIMDVDIFNFDGAKFLWKMPIALDAVQFGDVIIHARKPMFVTQVTPYTLFAVDPVDGEIKEIMPTKSPFGFNFVTKVMNFMDGMFGGAAPSAQNPFGNMWMMMAMDNSGEQSIDPMVLMAISMSQGGAINPMMLMAMSDKMDPDTRNAMLMMSMAAGQNQMFGMPAPHVCQCDHYEGKRVSEDEDAEQVNENARITIRPRPTDGPASPDKKPTQPKN